MSDSEGTEASVTPVEMSQSTTTRTAWSRKRARIEQAARMRSRSKKCISTQSTTDPWPSSHSTTPSVSEMETTDGTTASESSRDPDGRDSIVVRDQFPQPSVSVPTQPTPQPSVSFPTQPTTSYSSQPPASSPLPITPTTQPAQTGRAATSISPVSPRSPAWLRKRSQKKKAQRMRRGSLGVEGEEDTSTRDPDFSYHSDKEPEPDYASSDEEFSPQDFFDWMVSLRLDQRKMLGVILMENFKTRMKLNAKDAATEAGSVVGFNEKTVCRYRNDFFQNKGHFTIHLQGKYERHCVYHDEALNHKAAEWVREHAFVKGEPNMTAQSFCDWVNNTLLPSSHLPLHFPRSVSLRTSVRWLHNLGFKPVSHTKGVYIDGHEREDAVHHRKSLLKTLSDLRASHRPSPLCSDEPPRIRCEEDDEKKELVVIYHDEPIFNTNKGQTWMWGEEERPAIIPKTKGSGIMVSDFVEEHGGYLRLTDAELAQAKERYPNINPQARQQLEYGAEKEGYWTGDRFMAQVKNAADIADFKYHRDRYIIVWLFDQSSCHRKF